MRQRRAGPALPAIAVLAALLVLAGCTSRPTAAPVPPPPPPWQGTITLWLPAGMADDLRQRLQQRVQAYRGAHPTVTVELADKPDVSVALQHAASPPDLGLAGFDPHLWPRGCPALPDGEAVGSADWLPGVASAMAPAGSLCGLPVYVDGYVLALNLMAWKAANVTPPPGGRWSLAEFEMALHALRGGGVTPISLFTLPGYDEWWPLLLAGGGRLLDGTGQLALSETAIARLRDWASSGLLDPDAGKLPPATLYANLAADPPRLAMLPVPARLLPNLRQPPYQVRDLGVAAFPDGANLGRIYGFQLTGRDPSANRRAAAIALGRSLSDGETQRQWARQQGGFPAGRHSTAPYTGDAQLTAAAAAVADLQPLPAGHWWPTTEALLQRHLQLAVIGGESPGDALASARREIAASQRQAGR